MSNYKTSEIQQHISENKQTIPENFSQPKTDQYTDPPAKASSDTLLELLIKASAHLTIFSAELIATESAEKELEKFRTGIHDDLPVVFDIDSIESQELLNGSYYQELSKHLTEALADWYGGSIPDNNGLFMQANSYRVFGGKDFLREIVDGIDMADIIGSITYYVRVSTHKGEIYFQGTNVMSFESYSGENYFGANWVNNPIEGPFRSTTQVFNWKIPIPTQYRRTR
ncbi:hypothetical protein FLL45_15145 [Aliikangiella marina]|uniref:Uncharacterized protein n=1 Tax=Aliikangiella marina TaxID=1712262 RepID=A0A545T6F6_9GAMM|nr:hypothetical protein [Aliikangiella marina]TQV72803.1 hypothetical protein FLL45_15145 [Aliikangiella marina]